MAAHDKDSGDLSLTTIERLILSQAVYEHGADAWQSVSKVLSNHPALAGTTVFSPQVRVHFIPIVSCIVYSVYCLVLPSNLPPSYERSLT